MTSHLKGPVIAREGNMFQAKEMSKLEKDMAKAVKEAFDVKFGPTWHCVVGRCFGSHVTYETGYG